MAKLCIIISLAVTCTCKYYDRPYFPQKRTLRSPFRINGRDNYDWSDYKRPTRWLREDTPEAIVVTTYLRLTPNNPTLNRTLFPALIDEEIKATKSSTNKYPWIARVAHSPDNNQPHLCTAVCVEERIFATAARCIYKAKVVLTTVFSQDDDLQAIAFVTPSKPTKAMFEDIGFIIVRKPNGNRQWKTVKIYDKTDNKDFSRTDDHFLWLGEITKDKDIEGTAVGYVDHDGKQVPTLYEIKVMVSPYQCQHQYNTDLFRTGHYYKSDNYFVPCYHTCDVAVVYADRYGCKTRLAGEGHAVIEKKTSKLIGIATWGGYYAHYLSDLLLPVGMAIPNSKNFLEDFKCARKIRDAPDTSKTFADLCKT